MQKLNFLRYIFKDFLKCYINQTTTFSASVFVAFVDEHAAILCRHHPLVSFCLQEIHPLLWDQRGCVAFTQSLRLNALQTVGGEHRGVAETHFTGQVVHRSER